MIPAAMSSTWARQIPRSGKGISQHPAAEEFVQELADRGVVVGPVDAAGLDDHAGQALADQSLCHLVGLVLGLLVAGGEIGRRARPGLVDDLAAGVAEDADGGDVDDLGDLLLERRAQDPFGAADVGVAHRRPLGGRDPDLVDGGGVDHRVAAAHPVADRAFVAEVAADDLAAERRGARRLWRGCGRGSTTSSPRSRSWRTIAPPMNPVPPVTKTFTAANPNRLVPARTIRP